MRVETKRYLSPEDNQMSQTFSKMVIFIFSTDFGGDFYYQRNAKSHIETRLLHLGYCSNKLIRKTLVKKTNIFFFAS